MNKPQLKKLIQEKDQVIQEKDKYWKSSIERSELLLKENPQLIEQITKLKNSQNTTVNVNIKLNDNIISKCTSCNSWIHRH
jgi:hypothetical protein